MTRDSIWSSSEVEKLQTLMSLGMRRADIAEALGRTQKSIDGKVQYLSLSDEQREGLRVASVLAARDDLRRVAQQASAPAQPTRKGGEL